jgi:hypothetical protein
MVGARAGGRRHAFRDVEPVHAIGRLGTPPCREFPRITQRARSTAEEVRIKRQDDVGLLEAVQRVDVPAERQLCTAACVLAAGGIPLMPFRGRESREHLADLRRQRRGIDRLGQQTDAGAFERLLRRQRRADCAKKGGPRTNLAEVGQRLRAIGIVQIEDCGLREDVGRAAAARVQRVALDLRRPPFVAFDKQPGCRTAERHRRREEQRHARNQFFGLADVRDDLLGRLARACRDAGERHRGAHQLEERPARDWVGDCLDLRRKLVVKMFLKSGILCAFFQRAPKPRTRQGLGAGG